MSTKPTITLNTPVQYLKGVGPKMAGKLAKLDIFCVGDLLGHYPRTYIDFSQPTPFSRARIGELVVLFGTVLSIDSVRSPRKRMSIIKAKIGDPNQPDNSIVAVWYNQPFVSKNLRLGEQWYFCGKIGYDFQAKQKNILSPIYEQKSQILPIYPLTAGVTSKYLQKIITPLLADTSLLTEFLPAEIIKQEKLMDYPQAIRVIHFPDNLIKLHSAQARLAFNELFFIIIRLLLVRQTMSQARAPQIKTNTQLLVKFTKSLPYELTNAQRKASWQIIQDLTKAAPMNRLLEGDVGSGKTVVCLLAALNAITAGYQVVWMAPTEILATQHYQTAQKLLDKFAVKISLITGKQLKTNNPKLKTITSNSELKLELMKQDLVIGTHALIQQDCQYQNIGLVIIDEQHRFGVKQRAKLTANKINSKQNFDTPHFLSMTATPIPRTLALSIYSDLDISIIDEYPKNRQPIITRLVDPTDRTEAYEFIRSQISAGRQAFIVCPLIESKNDQAEITGEQLFNIDRKSVKQEYNKLSKQIFPDLQIAMLHGKLKSTEKEQIMADFSAGKTDILVSTSVIEVGVDVPNANIMLIEDAERFGLAQLHQFRGRVGRGQHQSYCLLFTSNLSVEANNRLNKLVDCDNGFQLAQADLELRGPGELAGSIQSGLPNLKITKLTDTILVNQTKRVAQSLIDQGLNNFPQLEQKITEFKSLNHLE